MRVIKDDLLHALERVQPALSDKEGLESAGRFFFSGGEVHAFNKKLYCASPCPFPVEGAVHSKLLGALKKINSEEVEILKAKGGVEVRFGRKSRDSVFVASEDVPSPADVVDCPEEWAPLHESFSDALSLVQECAGKDRERMYVATCVHVHPKWLEASDGKQACFYKIKTGVKSPCLVERDTLKHVAASGVDEIGETQAWLHFRGNGLRMACRREVADYPELRHVFDEDGEPVTLPSSLAELAELCEEFSKEDKDNNVLIVEIREDMMRVEGRGSVGHAEGFRPCVYSGPDVKFCLSPALLKGLTEKSNECYVNENTLIIDGGKWCYVTAVAEAD